MDRSLALASQEQLLANKHHSLKLLPMLEFTAHFTSVDCSRATFGGFLLEDILLGDDTRENSDVFFPHENQNVAYVPSIPDTTRPRRSSRPSRIRVASFVSSSPPISAWFDDSPTCSVFTIADEDASISSWGNNHEYLAHPTFPDCEYDRTSIISFSPLSETTSSLTSESQDSHTMVPTEDDGESTFSGAKDDLIDCLDEQLVLSPIESFAAMCWDAAVVPDKPRLKVNKAAAPELRFSKLYNDAARRYEEAHVKESSRLAKVTLPRMKFDDVIQVSKTAPPEVAPWLYVSKKATSMLDLPQDLTAAVKSPQLSVTPSRADYQRHRRGKATLGSITKLPFSLSFAGKRQNVINCMNGGEHNA